MLNSIKQYRESSGYTLQTLADKCGASKAYIWELEQGKSTPSIRLAYAISSVFCVDVQKIFPDDQQYEEVVTKTVRKIKAA